MGVLLNRVALVAAGSIALAGGAIASVPAGAAAPGVHAVARAAASSHVVPATTPSSKIKGQGSTAKYKPTALTVAEDTSGGNCGESTPPVSFTIKNTGTKSAYVTFDGAPGFKLPKGETEDICLYGGTAGDQATLGLSNKADTVTYASTLTITASD
jgi:hypothetical protein